MQDLCLRVQFYRRIGFLPQKTTKSEWIFFHENCVPGKENMEEAEDGMGLGQKLRILN